MMKITSCYLSKQGAKRNLESLLNFSEENWLKEAYTSLSLDYPKFHKMDNLSKMTILATELICQVEDFSVHGDEAVEFIFANTNASQHTDMKFIHSYTEQGNPSPSLFVYTLPNILTGEMAIRHKWYGENTFFISPTFDANLFANRIKHAALRGNERVLCGWSESALNESGQLQNEECLLFTLAINEQLNTQQLVVELNKLWENYQISKKGF